MPAVAAPGAPLSDPPQRLQPAQHQGRPSNARWKDLHTGTAPRLNSTVVFASHIQGLEASATSPTSPGLLAEVGSW